MNRGQISGYAAQWILFSVLMLIIMFGSLYFLLGNLLYPPRNPFPAEASIIANNLLFSTDGYAAIDPSGRALPGVIDATKLTKNLDTVFQGKRLTGAKITIDGQTYYYRRAVFDTLWPRVGIKGRGGAQQYVESYVLLLKSATSQRSVPVIIEVLGEGQ